MVALELAWPPMSQNTYSVTLSSATSARVQRTHRDPWTCNTANSKIMEETVSLTRSRMNLAKIFSISRLGFCVLCQPLQNTLTGTLVVGFRICKKGNLLFLGGFSNHFWIANSFQPSHLSCLSRCGQFPFMLHTSPFFYCAHIHSWFIVLWCILSGSLCLSESESVGDFNKSSCGVINDTWHWPDYLRLSSNCPSLRGSVEITVCCPTLCTG